MKHLIFYVLLFMTLVNLSAQVTSPKLTCDCVWRSVINDACTPAKVPFSVKFNGRDAEMTMRGYEYKLRYVEAWVDPTGMRNSVYVKDGEVEVHTTYPLADNWVYIGTHPGGQEISSAFCYLRPQ